MSGQSRLALHDQGAPPQAVYAVFRDALGGTGCPEFNACAHGAKTVVRAVNCAGPPSGINSDPSTHGKRSQQSPSALQHHQHRQGRAALVAPVRYTVLRISHATRTASVNVLMPWHFG